MIHPSHMVPILARSMAVDPDPAVVNTEIHIHIKPNRDLPDPHTIYIRRHDETPLAAGRRARTNTNLVLITIKKPPVLLPLFSLCSRRQNEAGGLGAVGRLAKGREPLREEGYRAGGDKRGSKIVNQVGHILNAHTQPNQILR